MTAPSRKAAAQRAYWEQYLSKPRIIADMRREKFTEREIARVCLFMEDKGPIAEQARELEPERWSHTPSFRVNGVFTDLPGHGGHVLSDDPRRNAAADACFDDTLADRSPKGY